MSDLTFDSLSVVAVTAFVAPLVVDRIRTVRIPVAVIEILLGVAIGPEALGWAEVDEPVQVLALLGLAFVLFLAGFELDLHKLRGGLLRSATLGYLCVLATSVVVGVGLDQMGLVDSPLLAAILLSATSLALVTPVLRDGGQVSSRLGQLSIAGASLSEFAAVALLSLLFTKETESTSVRIALASGFVGLIVIVGLVAGRIGRWSPVQKVMERLHGGTSQIRIRGAIMVMALFVVLAQEVGLEAILGALVAGAILGVLDRGDQREQRDHTEFRGKLDAVGYGFLAPAFFIWSGMSIDVQALVDQPSRVALIGLFLVALLVVHIVAVPIYRPTVGGRAAVVVGLLGSTSSLPFVVTATAVGQESGFISAATAAALLVAGVLSALLYPVIALAIVRREEAVGELEPVGT